MGDVACARAGDIFAGGHDGVAADEEIETGGQCWYNVDLCGTCVQPPARADPRAAVKQVSA